MKNNKGISLLSLVSMIIVMIILAAISINVGTNSYQNALKSKATAERQQVISAVTGRFGDNQRNSTSNPIVGLMIPDEYLDNEEKIIEYITTKLRSEYGKLMTDEEIANQTNRTQIEHFVYDNFNDMEYTRLVFYNDLIDLGIENTNLNAIYLVNYYSSDVVGPID